MISVTINFNNKCDNKFLIIYFVIHFSGMHLACMLLLTFSKILQNLISFSKTKSNSSSMQYSIDGVLCQTWTPANTSRLFRSVVQMLKIVKIVKNIGLTKGVFSIFFIILLFSFSFIHDFFQLSTRLIYCRMIQNCNL